METENHFISNPQRGKLNKLYERRIYWDSSEPMFAYTDEPDLTFTDYLVYCGGLMGLWFGQSAKDLISTLIDITFWRLLLNSITDMFLYVKYLSLKLYSNLYQLLEIIIIKIQNITKNIVFVID